MKKPTAFHRVIPAFLLFLIANNISAQNLYQISIDQKIQRSSLIVEGIVTEQESFWNPQHTMIYTANRVEISRIFKGIAQSSFIEVVTVGGSVDNTYIKASDLLTLEKNAKGVFFCWKNVLGLLSPRSKEELYDIYGSSQGFLKYDPAGRTANAPFVRYKNITHDLYNELTNKTGNKVEIKNSTIPVLPVEIPGSPNSPNSPNAPSITSFSPLTVNAGALLDPTNNLLTITGTGFGNSPASMAAVFFDDADDGDGGNFTTVAFNSPLIVSWNNTQIRVRVPTNAGTGSIIVRDNAGAIFTSATALTVRYAVLTGDFTGLGVIKEVNLMDANSAGGYTILYSTSTSNSGININTATEKATFQRALNTWKQSSGFNITEGGTDAAQNVNVADGKNMIMFDNGGTGMAPLADGVLAVCLNTATMCTNNVPLNQAQKPEFDIVIRNAGFSTGTAIFTAGPCPPLASDFNALDLETVILHELGHALSLGHINDSYEGGTIGQINPTKLMNFALVNSVKRSTPDFSAMAGATYLITPQSNTYGPCGITGEMVPLSITTESRDECPASFPSTATPATTVVSFDLVHATSNKFVDPAFTQMHTDSSGTSITNTAYYAFKTDPTGGILSLNVTGYSTTPAAQAACTPAFGIPVTGVDLALYRVSTCPVASAFPLPVATRSFQANGAISNITGLLANTNYLLVLDGTENTKASFSLSFSGSALPIQLSDFSGQALSDRNLLSWTIDIAHDVKIIYLERSGDGVNFEKLTQVDYLSSPGKGSFPDIEPLTGNNFYRMAVTNIDGSKQYSKIVLLNRKDAFLLTAFPNPAKEFVELRMTFETNGQYSVVLHNEFGQLMMRKDIRATNLRQHVKLSVSGLAAGIYHISLYNHENKLMKSTQMTITK